MANEHHEKTITIIVNGRERTVTEKDLSFTEVVTLAFDNPPFGQNTIYTVTYKRGHGDKQGSLVEGQSVKAKEGMIFNVTPTDKS